MFCIDDFQHSIHVFRVLVRQRAHSVPIGERRVVHRIYRVLDRVSEQARHDASIVAVDHSVVYFFV